MYGFVDNAAFREILKEWRGSVHLSQAELAEIMDVSEMTIYRWENEEYNTADLNHETMKALARALATESCGRDVRKLYGVLPDFAQDAYRQKMREMNEASVLWQIPLD